MVSVIGQNIISPLGKTASENYNAVRNGRTSIRQWHGLWRESDNIAASLFSEKDNEDMIIDGCSRGESLAIRSIRDALLTADIDTGSPRTVLILSTTKGNIAWLGREDVDAERILPTSSAQTIAHALGVKTQPIVVDNACISGLSAIILGSRLLELGFYDQAIVCGVETQSQFIVSGFQSLQALSSAPCRPFDMERCGLNLGEAAATIVLSNKPGTWHIASGAMRNDAYHISAPSKNGEGARLALKAIIGENDGNDIAFVNAHGTATLFNDQMESVAIDRAGLGQIPVNALKGNYGHTMGACGILETILSMLAIDDGIVLPTKYFEELGVSGDINIASKEAKTAKRSFIKTLSGFGGCNAAVLASKQTGCTHRPAAVSFRTTHHVHITPTEASMDGKTLLTAANGSTGKAFVTEIYKQLIGNYPRFYKMDLLCRLGFVASELLLKAEGTDPYSTPESRAVALIGHSGSICADRNYLQSFVNPNDYYPSPERFVYTLPNIVTGEIAIRNHYHGETAFYMLPWRDNDIIRQLLCSTLADQATKSIIGGWLNCDDEEHFEADINIIIKEQ